MRIIICDDEKINIEVNKVYLKSFLKMKKINNVLISSFTEYNERLEEKIQNKSIDIAILDIDMKKKNLNGIQLAEKIQSFNKNAIIVFVTSHPEYALEAFHVRAIGFIQKPYDQTTFNQRFEKALVCYQGVTVLNRVNKVIEFGKQYCDAFKIQYLEKIKNKLYVHMSDKTITANLSLYMAEQQLPDYFIKIERGIIINGYSIVEITNHRVMITDGTSFHIPERKYKKVIEEYNKFLEKTGGEL